jgi:hypothetical protein
LAPLAALAGALLWSYWPVLVDMAVVWWADPQYSHGFLVPVFSLYLFWSYGPLTGPLSSKPVWLGLAVLSLGLGLRLAGAFWFFGWIEAVSLLAALAGSVLLIGGWPALRRGQLAIAFLVFMIPLPYSVETAVAGPLQRAATELGTYALQTIGRPAIAEGTTIIVGQVRVGGSSSFWQYRRLWLPLSIGPGLNALSSLSVPCRSRPSPIPAGSSQSYCCTKRSAAGGPTYSVMTWQDG